jgi:hypothetical protein
LHGELKPWKFTCFRQYVAAQFECPQRFLLIIAVAFLETTAVLYSPMLSFQAVKPFWNNQIFSKLKAHPLSIQLSTFQG